MLVLAWRDGEVPPNIVLPNTSAEETYPDASEVSPTAPPSSSVSSVAEVRATLGYSSLSSAISSLNISWSGPDGSYCSSRESVSQLLSISTLSLSLRSLLSSNTARIFPDVSKISLGLRDIVNKYSAAGQVTRVQRSGDNWWRGVSEGGMLRACARRRA